MPSVRLDGLRKQFGEVLAVNDVSVEFRDGEMTAVLGPSGCGKTTTLNLIAASSIRIAARFVSASG